MDYTANQSRRRETKSGNVSRFLNSASVKYSAFLAFITIVLLTGGASRPDVSSLLILRPAAFLFLGYACLVITRQQFDLVRAPFILLSCLAALMLLQLIPLPPSIWSSLPQRDVIYAVSKDLDLQDLWRPLSMVPSRTLNSLLSLSVPAAAIMLFALLDDKQRKQVPLVIVIMGVASMLLGLLQIAGPSEGPLYTYAITNNGSAVGFFANRNHHAVFLACLIPIVVAMLFDRLSSKRAGKIDQNFLYIALTVGMIIFVLPFILVTGSRAGALMAVVGLLLSALLWALWLASAKRSLVGADNLKTPGTFKRSVLLKRIGLVPIVSAFLLLGVVAAIYFDRDFAINRYFELSKVEDLRTQALPVLLEMAKNHFPIGAGFGSFENLYKMWEPDSLLTPSYFNQAHNDGLQWIIEGGLPAITILAALIWMIALRGIDICRSLIARERIQYVKIAAFFVTMMIFAASLADYPLRTPIMMVFFSLIICIFLRRSPQSKVEQALA
jgi:O-antigen ligase